MRMLGRHRTQVCHWPWWFEISIFRSSAGNQKTNPVWWHLKNHVGSIVNMEKQTMQKLVSLRGHVRHVHVQDLIVPTLNPRFAAPTADPSQVQMRFFSLSPGGRGEDFPVFSGARSAHALERPSTQRVSAWQFVKAYGGYLKTPCMNSVALYSDV